MNALQSCGQERTTKRTSLCIAGEQLCLEAPTFTTERVGGHGKKSGVRLGSGGVRLQVLHVLGLVHCNMVEVPRMGGVEVVDDGWVICRVMSS